MPCLARSVSEERTSVCHKMLPTDEDDEEVVGTEYGHPSLFHDAVLGEKGAGWYDEVADAHVLEDTDEAVEGPTSPPAKSLQRMDSKFSLYGTNARIDCEEVTNLMPRGDGGQVWHAQVLADHFQAPAKLCKPDGTLKARRPMPVVRASDFFSSLSAT